MLSVWLGLGDEGGGSLFCLCVCVCLCGYVVGGGALSCPRLEAVFFLCNVGGGRAVGCCAPLELGRLCLCVLSWGGESRRAGGQVRQSFRCRSPWRGAGSRWYPLWFACYVLLSVARNGFLRSGGERWRGDWDGVGVGTGREGSTGIWPTSGMSSIG